jgi:hypothetical protein
MADGTRAATTNAYGERNVSISSTSRLASSVVVSCVSTRSTPRKLNEHARGRETPSKTGAMNVTKAGSPHFLARIAKVFDSSNVLLARLISSKGPSPSRVALTKRARRSEPGTACDCESNHLMSCRRNGLPNSIRSRAKESPPAAHCTARAKLSAKASDVPTTASTPAFLRSSTRYSVGISVNSPKTRAVRVNAIVASTKRGLFTIDFTRASAARRSASRSRSRSRAVGSAAQRVSTDCPSI